MSPRSSFQVRTQWIDRILLGRLNNPAKRVAYATERGIRHALLTIQRAIRGRVHRVMTVRDSRFIDREAAKITTFPSVKQGRIFGEIQVGEKPRLLLGRFEEGGPRTPFTKGAKSVAVPVDARPNERAPVPESLFFKRLRFKKQRLTTTAARRRRRGGTSETIYEGEQDTYLIPREGVFQRLASGVSRVLYVFARHLRLDKRLRFIHTAKLVAGKAFSEEFRRQVADAFRRRGII